MISCCSFNDSPYHTAPRFYSVLKQCSFVCPIKTTIINKASNKLFKWSSTTAKKKALRMMKTKHALSPNNGNGTSLKHIQNKQLLLFSLCSSLSLSPLPYTWVQQCHLLWLLMSQWLWNMQIVLNKISTIVLEHHLLARQTSQPLLYFGP